MSICVMAPGPIAMDITHQFNWQPIEHEYAVKSVHESLKKD